MRQSVYGKKGGKAMIRTGKPAGTKDSRPNIVLIMSDNQSADFLGSYGNAEVKTPAIDQLASQGSLFENAYCVNAMCSPCRASVLTGLMPSAHGIHTWLDDGLADKWPERWNAIGEFDTLPDRLKASGYHTALIGKYHLGSAWQPPHAFDHWVTFPHGHTISFYDNQMIVNQDSFTHSGHSVDFFASQTVEFIQQQEAAEQPFFCFVPFNGPYGHWPSIKGRAKTRFADLYDDSPLASVPREGLNKRVLDRYIQRVLEAGAEPSERFAGPLLLPNETESIRNYFAQISLVDDAVGRIMAQLEASNLAENTIIIYTADHGFSLGNHGIWGHGLAAWPASMHRPSYHIPLVMRGPSLASGPRRQLVSQLDLANTLLDACGAGLLDTPRQDSRVINLGDRQARHREAVFLEQEESRAIRTETHLYIERFQHTRITPLAPELYDLDADPEERSNISESEQAAPIKARLAAELASYFQHHADPARDLWAGGTAKSNLSNLRFWQQAWGSGWQCGF